MTILVKNESLYNYLKENDKDTTMSLQEYFYLYTSIPNNYHKKKLSDKMKLLLNTKEKYSLAILNNLVKQYGYQDTAKKLNIKRHHIYNWSKRQTIPGEQNQQHIINYEKNQYI